MNQRPLHLGRTARAIVERIAVLDLNLSGLQVLTEAATGAYAVTPVIAAVAGAEVVVLSRDSRYGTVAEAWSQTSALAAELGVRHRIRMVDELDRLTVSKADIVTNSGHLRPLNSKIIAEMKQSAVIPLMYEAWELRSTDVDVNACRQKGVNVAGTNERHASVGVFQYLGMLVVKVALEEGFAIFDDRCLVLSDNDFGHYIAETLSANGAKVTSVETLAAAGSSEWDIIVIATLPPLSGGRRVCLDDVRASLYCQVWGDVDRGPASENWRPAREPQSGHMGLTLDSLGHSPVVRLQAAGLKCGELMLRPSRDEDLMHLIQWVFPEGVSTMGSGESCSHSEAE